MDYTHTEAYQMPSVYLHEKMKKFPHCEKFTLQKDIRESIVGLKTGQKLPPFPFIIFIKERW